MLIYCKEQVQADRQFNSSYEHSLQELFLQIVLKTTTDHSSW